MAADCNSVSDEIRNEAKKVWQTKKGIERYKYFVYYYKVHFLVAIGAIALITSVIHWYATMKDSIFQITVINNQPAEYYDINPFIEDFSATLDYDPKKEEVTTDAYYQIDINAGDQYNQTLIQRVFINITIGDMDVMLCDEDFMKLTRTQDVAYNLVDILPQELISKYEDKFVWYDFPEEELLEKTDNVKLQEQFKSEYEQEYGGRNEAVCIDVTDFAKIKDSGMYYEGKKVYLYIIGNAPHLDTAIKFLEYLDTP